MYPSYVKLMSISGTQKLQKCLLRIYLILNVLLYTLIETAISRPLPLMNIHANFQLSFGGYTKFFL